MEPHVLCAVLYWLLLPFALLAGEWGRARRALGCDRVCAFVPAPGLTSGPPLGEAGPGEDCARAGAEIPRDAQPWRPHSRSMRAPGRPGPRPSARLGGRRRGGGQMAPGRPRGRAMSAPRRGRRLASPSGALGVGGVGKGVSGPYAGGLGHWRGGANLFFFFVLKKKKEREREKENAQTCIRTS